MSGTKNVKVSIIMPSYNSAEYIGNAIKSVLGQTYKDFEFIIIDDCSTDNSREVIDSFQDTRIKKIFFEKNEHMWFVHNYAISISRGKYIAEINDDDYWHLDKLKKQVEYMETHSECGACFTLVNVVDEKDNILTERDTFLVSLFNVRNRSRIEWIRHFYFKGSCLCHPSVLIRRDVMDKVGIYNYSLLQIADFELWVRIVKQYEIYVIQEKLIDFQWFSSGRNVSAPSDEVNVRSDTEFFYVISKYFDDMSDELFIEVFSEDFLDKDTRSHEELLCEKAFLLSKHLFCGYPGKIGGIVKLIELLQEKGTRNILREKYNFTQKNLYELTASPIFYGTTIATKVQYFNEQQEYIGNLKRDLESQNRYIQELEDKRKSQQKYIGNLERDLKSQSDYAQEMKEKQKNQQEYIGNLERDLESQNNYVQETVTSINQLKKHLEQIESENSVLRLQIEDKKQEIVRIEERNEEYQTSIRYLEETLAVQNRHITNLENKIERYIDSQKRR